MADIVCNIAKGALIAYYDRVKNNDQANCALIVVPLETSDLEADAVLMDKETLADLLSGTTNEQTTMGRKTLTDADLAAIPAPDHTNDRNERNLPAIEWTAAAGNPISKLAICYDPDTTAGTDANIVPMVILDAVATPDGSTTIRRDAGLFGRAS